MPTTRERPQITAQSVRRPTVVIGHPCLGRAGSESVVMWLIEALKRDFEITVITTGGWDLHVLNAYYGTQIQPGEVQVRIAPVPWPFGNYRAAALRGACYQRFACQVAGEYDVRISAYNFTDWGLPSIHFLADFSWDPQLSSRLDRQSPGFIYRDTLVRRAYLVFARLFAKPSNRNMLHDDLVIANSNWAAALVHQHYGATCAAVVYPPVWDEFPKVSCQEKKPAFAMIGRVTPEKRIEQAIAIIEAVRQRGHNIRLHVCGEIKDDHYGSQIARLCDRHTNWIIREGLVSGDIKRKLLANCKFGIQARNAEPFGISVAEMVKSGAIVFAPNNGGPTEILDAPVLLFYDLSDAVEKICTVLENESMQTELRTHLSSQAKLFSTSAFIRASREIISKFTQFGAEFGNVEQVDDDSIDRNNLIRPEGKFTSTRGMLDQTALRRFCERANI
jgi:glycosyltransferase involved in cell wall biosynthesis